MPEDKKLADQETRDEILPFWNEQKTRISRLNELAAEKIRKEVLIEGNPLPPKELAGRGTPYADKLREAGPTYIQFKYKPNKESVEVLIAISAKVPPQGCAYAHAQIFWNPRIFGSTSEIFPADEEADAEMRKAIFKTEMSGEGD